MHGTVAAVPVLGSKGSAVHRACLSVWYGSEFLVEGVSKPYPEIGDRPKKVQSNPPKGSIEPLKRFYRPEALHGVLQVAALICPKTFPNFLRLATP